MLQYLPHRAAVPVPVVFLAWRPDTWFGLIQWPHLVGELTEMADCWSDGIRGHAPVILGPARVDLAPLRGDSRSSCLHYLQIFVGGVIGVEENQCWVVATASGGGSRRL